MIANIRVLLLFTLLIGVVSCSDDDDDEIIVKPVLDVNYANMSGTWSLSEWNGEKMDADTRYYYITLSRNEENGDHNYQIYTNLNSFVSEHITGTYQLNSNEDLGDIINGTYDYTLSTEDEWAHQYIVSELYEESMKWIAVDDNEEVRIYKRCSEVPSDIVAGTQF